MEFVKNTKYKKAYTLKGELVYIQLAIYKSKSGRLYTRPVSVIGKKKVS